LLSSVSGSTYSVSFRRLNNNTPVVSSLLQESSFKWNYNTAIVPGQSSFGVLVRCQDQQNPNEPYSVTPSKLAYAELRGPWNPNVVIFSNITEASVVFESSGPSEAYGTEDPRVVYRNKTGEYYLLYSAVQNSPIISRLALAVSKTPSVAGSWQRYGPLFPNELWSKSGSMLIRDGYPGPHYLFYGDCSIYPGLQIATSPDLINWTIQPGLLIEKRAASFDSALVEAGPMPLQLSDGNYLFIYNSARHGYPSVKPGWDVQYNVGWVILDQNDPTKVLQRSDEPLFSPVLDWEIGTAPQLGLTPNVVFLEGWIPYTENQFIVAYGAADSVTGIGLITVTISQ